MSSLVTGPGQVDIGVTTPGQVDLTWSAATDNVGVTGYDVFRDGTPLATIGATTAYSDSTVTPATTYSYQVRARDAAGNLSGLSASTSVTTPAAGGSLQLTPVADATVKQDSPTTNYGGASTLEVDNSPVKHVLLTYDLSSVGAQQILGAKLRLSVLDSSTTGGDIRRTATTSWSEGTVTWNTAPAVDAGSPTVWIGAVSSGQTVDVDVSSLISGSTLSLRVSSTSSNGADYSSKEGSFAPQLLLTLGWPQ